MTRPMYFICAQFIYFNIDKHVLVLWFDEEGDRLYDTLRLKEVDIGTDLDLVGDADDVKGKVCRAKFKGVFYDAEIIKIGIIIVC